MPLILLLLLSFQSSPGVTVTPPCPTEGHACQEDDLRFATVEIKATNACGLIAARLRMPEVLTLSFAPTFAAIKNESTNPQTAIMVPVQKVKKGDKGRIIYCRFCHSLLGMEVE
jgi:hypothetical protein